MSEFGVGTDFRIGQFVRLTDIKKSEFVEDSLMRLFHSKTRNTVRKSLNTGVSIFKNFSYELGLLILHDNAGTALPQVISSYIPFLNHNYSSS